MSIGRRLFIVDPSLRDIRGHHYSLAKAVTESAVLSRLSVLWLAAFDASDELKSHSNLIPIFGRSMYSSYKTMMKESKGGVVQKLGRLRARLRLPGSDTVDRAIEPPSDIDTKSSMLDSLLDAFGRFGIGPADRLLFHTADGATYEALAELVQSFPVADLPLIHVCTPYDPVGVMPNRESPEVVRQAIDVFRLRNLLGRRVFLYGENPGLAEHLSKIWGCHVNSLDLPIAPVTEAAVARARTYRHDRLSTTDKQFLVVSLGAARLEKGFHLIPDIVRRTFEYSGVGEFSEIHASKVKFALHASAQIIGRHPVIEKALERLQHYSREQVELLTEPLSDIEYQNLTNASDAILMPYDEQAYRVRGSGVVAEAIVAKKFIVAKSGSYPAEMAILQGGAVGDTPANIAKAMLTMIQNRCQRFDRVEQTSEEYLATNSIQQYVVKMIASERRGNQNPTRIVL